MNQLHDSCTVSADLITTCKVLGTYDASLKYDVGNVVFKEGRTCIYDGYEFHLVGDLQDLEEHESIVYELTKLECCSCGGTLSKLNDTLYRCNYCGSLYEWRPT